MGLGVNLSNLNEQTLINNVYSYLLKQEIRVM